MGVEYGDCPKCNKDTLVCGDSEFPDNVHLLNTAECQSCGAVVKETYKLISQEVVKECQT